MAAGGAEMLYDRANCVRGVAQALLPTRTGL
jgi:hypothetical protein